MGMKEISDVIHKTINQFFDVCGDDEEVSIVVNEINLETRIQVKHYTNTDAITKTI